MKAKKKTRVENFPKKIKIAYSNFDLIAKDKTWSNANEAHGTCDYDNCKIEYNSTQKRPEIVNTIIHEVLHAVIHVFDIHFDSPKIEEDVVTKLANGLQTVLWDNPELSRIIINSESNVKDE